MPESRVIPIDQPSSRPGFTVLIDGSALAPSVQLMTINVHKKLNRIAAAEISLLDGDAASEDWPLSTSEQFLPGAAIEIRAGYAQDFQSIFSGEIVEHSIRARQGKPGRLLLQCRDKAYRMTLGRKSKYFYESSDADILQDLIESYGLTAEVDQTATTHLNMVQYAASDWDFLVSRAEANRLLVFNDNGLVKVAEPQVASEAEVAVIYGATVLEFEGSIDARRQMAQVKVSSWQASSQENEDSELASLEEPAQGNLSGAALAEKSGFEEEHWHFDAQLPSDEREAAATHHLQKARIGVIRGRVLMQGLPQLKPGQTIELMGLGERFNGQGYIAGIRHELSGGSFTTDVELGLPEESFYQEFAVNRPVAGGLLPAIHGLHPAVVKALADDPAGEYRIQVSLPAVDPSEEGIWARVATLDAGDQRGSFFLPEIGDEVVVAFLDNDPRHPVVLGTMHSSAKAAPAQASDDNHEKGFVTRSGMRIWLNDDEVSLSIDTPNGNKILLSESDGAITIEDENGNTTSHSSSGIEVESASDISLKASGEIKLEATNISLKADAEFSAEGSASAKVESGGSTTVKGSVVQIN